MPVNEQQLDAFVVLKFSVFLIDCYLRYDRRLLDRSEVIELVVVVIDVSVVAVVQFLFCVLSTCLFEARLDAVVLAMMRSCRLISIHRCDIGRSLARFGECQQITITISCSMKCSTLLHQMLMLIFPRLHCVSLPYILLIGLLNR